jgi:hypothetical protein
MRSQGRRELVDLAEREARVLELRRPGRLHKEETTGKLAKIVVPQSVLSGVCGASG